MEKLREVLGDGYANFDKLNSIEKTVYVLGSELWECDFNVFLSLVKEYVVDVWEARKQKIYGEDSCPGQLQSSAGDLQLSGGNGQRVGKFCSSAGKGRTDCLVCTGMYGSAHDCGCVVDGTSAMAAL